MRCSLRLIAQSLENSGHHAQVINDCEGLFSKVRMLPSSFEALQPDTIYACEKIPEGLVGDVLLPSNAATIDPECAFAIIEQPPSSFDGPCIVVESAQNATELLNALADAEDDLDAIVSEASTIVWQDDGLADIVETLTRALGNPVYVVDSSFKVMAIADDPDMEEMSVNWMHAAKHGYLSYDLIANLIRSNELHDIESSDSATLVHSEFFYTPFINYNLRLSGKVQGHLFVVEMYKNITAADLELVDIIAPFALRALQANPAFQTQRGPLYEHFVIDWLEEGLRDSVYIRRQLDALLFDAEAPVVVGIIQLLIDGDFRREHLARLIEDRQGCRAVPHGNQVIALFQLKHLKDRTEVLRKVASICRSQKCRASISDAQDKLTDAPRAYRQAREALRIRNAMGLDDDVVVYADVAAYQPYLNFSTPEELDAFCHPGVIALRNYDRTHAVKLLPTLSAFLKNERDVQRTADEMFIHRNTLSYRMKKITELCPFDLDDFGTRHRLLESILIVENYSGITARMQTDTPEDSTR